MIIYRHLQLISASSDSRILFGNLLLRGDSEDRSTIVLRIELLTSKISALHIITLCCFILALFRCHGDGAADSLATNTRIRTGSSPVNLLKPTGYLMHQQFNLLNPTGYLMHQQFNLLNPAGYLMHQQFNLLNPTGYVMHQQFNIQQLYVLPTLYLCVLYLSENKQRLVPLTA